MKGRRVLITGGAGFIGTALARRLVGANQVVIFDNLHRDALAGTDVASHPSLELVRGDVLDAGALREAARGCDAVIHLAAIAGVDTVLKMPVKTMEVSLLGTYNALEAAREHGARRFIDFSTSEVFGTFAYKVSERDVTHLGAVGEARWTYAVSKLATEHLAFNYNVQYGLPSVSIRPFNIYGPGQVGEGAIHRFIVRALAGERLEIHNDGAQIRAWCYIDDIVEAVLLCLAADEAVGHAFNVGNPRSVCTVYDLARRVIALSGSKSELGFVEWPHPDVELRVPDISKARELLSWEPSVDLDEGLRRTIEWYRGRRAE